MVMRNPVQLSFTRKKQFMTLKIKTQLHFLKVLSNTVDSLRFNALLLLINVNESSKLFKLSYSSFYLLSWPFILILIIINIIFECLLLYWILQIVYSMLLAYLTLLSSQWFYQFLTWWRLSIKKSCLFSVTKWIHW